MYVPTRGTAESPYILFFFVCIMAGSLILLYSRFWRQSKSHQSYTDMKLANMTLKANSSNVPKGQVLQ